MKIANRLRRHWSPLNGDTASTLDLPPVRMGLLTKLNLLIVGLIFITAIAVSLFHFAQQWRDDEQQLRKQGSTMLGVMAKLAEHGVHTSDKAYLEQMLESVSNDPDVALRRRIRRQPGRHRRAPLQSRSRQGGAATAAG